MVQIDDVVCDFDVVVAVGVKEMEMLFPKLGEMYEDFPYPLDPIKSINGRSKFIFLNDGIGDGVYIALPLSVALKADADQIAAIRTINGDIASFYCVQCWCCI